MIESSTNFLDDLSCPTQPSTSAISQNCENTQAEMIKKAKAFYAGDIPKDPETQNEINEWLESLSEEDLQTVLSEIIKDEPNAIQDLPPTVWNYSWSFDVLVAGDLGENFDFDDYEYENLTPEQMTEFIEEHYDNLSKENIEDIMSNDKFQTDEIKDLLIDKNNKPKMQMQKNLSKMLSNEKIKTADITMPSSLKDVDRLTDLKDMDWGKTDLTSAFQGTGFTQKEFVEEYELNTGLSSNNIDLVNDDFSTSVPGFNQASFLTNFSNSNPTGNASKVNLKDIDFTEIVSGKDFSGFVETKVKKIGFSESASTLKIFENDTLNGGWISNGNKWIWSNDGGWKYNKVNFSRADLPKDFDNIDKKILSYDWNGAPSIVGTPDALRTTSKEIGNFPPKTIPKNKQNDSPYLKDISATFTDINLGQAEELIKSGGFETICFNMDNWTVPNIDLIDLGCSFDGIGILDKIPKFDLPDANISNLLKNFPNLIHEFDISELSLTNLLNACGTSMSCPDLDFDFNLDSDYDLFDYEFNKLEIMQSLGDLDALKLDIPKLCEFNRQVEEGTISAKPKGSIKKPNTSKPKMATSLPNCPSNKPKTRTYGYNYPPLKPCALLNDKLSEGKIILQNKAEHIWSKAGEGGAGNGVNLRFINLEDVVATLGLASYTTLVTSAVENNSNSIEYVPTVMNTSTQDVILNDGITSTKIAFDEKELYYNGGNTPIDVKALGGANDYFKDSLTGNILAIDPKTFELKDTVTGENFSDTSRLVDSSDIAVATTELTEAEYGNSVKIIDADTGLEVDQTAFNNSAYQITKIAVAKVASPSILKKIDQNFKQDLIREFFGHACPTL